MIALLAMLPLRRRNFIGLELAQQLTRQSDGWRIAIAGEQTKNHQPIDMVVPAALTPVLETYLKDHRPHLLAAGPGKDQNLWLSTSGRPLSGLRAWQVISQHTEQHLGVAVNPHLFRDCAASFLGEADPENVRMAGPILGHANFTTTERHYIAAQSRGALRKHHEAIRIRRTLSKQTESDVSVD